MAFKMYVDGDGLPYSDYANYRGIELGVQRSILAVAERGLWYWNTFLRSRFQRPLLLSYDWERWPENHDGNPKDRISARAMLANCADWMLAELRTDHGQAYWEYPYPFSYNTPAGWRSGHAQAVGCQVLAIAAEVTGERRYLDPIPHLLRSFEIAISDGGFAVLMPSGGIWFEKIAHPANVQPRVLNGHLFAVLGLFDVAKRTGCGTAKRLAMKGVQAARDELHHYDIGNWSAYSVDGKRASLHYHGIHIEQLRRLRWRGGMTFLRYHTKFEQQRLAAGAATLK